MLSCRQFWEPFIEHVFAKPPKLVKCASLCQDNAQRSPAGLLVGVLVDTQVMRQTTLALKTNKREAARAASSLQSKTSNKLNLPGSAIKSLKKILSARLYHLAKFLDTSVLLGRCCND